MTHKCSTQALFSSFFTIFLEEIPFYQRSERGGTFLFIYSVKNYACCWLEVHVHALLGGLVVQIKLFYWCGLIMKKLVGHIKFGCFQCCLYIQLCTKIISNSAVSIQFISKKPNPKILKIEVFLWWNHFRSKI